MHITFEKIAYSMYARIKHGFAHPKNNINPDYQVRAQTRWLNVKKAVGFPYVVY